jgi:hypothetical protein
MVSRGFGTLLTSWTNLDMGSGILGKMRQARLDSPGTLHHVIVRGIEKQPIVDHETDRTVSRFADKLDYFGVRKK